MVSSALDAVEYTRSPHEYGSSIGVLTGTAGGASPNDDWPFFRSPLSPIPPSELSCSETGPPCEDIQGPARYEQTSSSATRIADPPPAVGSYSPSASVAKPSLQALSDTTPAKFQHMLIGLKKVGEKHRPFSVTKPGLSTPPKSAASTSPDLGSGVTSPCTAFVPQASPSFSGIDEHSRDREDSRKDKYGGLKFPKKPSAAADATTRSQPPQRPGVHAINPYQRDVSWPMVPRPVPPMHSPYMHGTNRVDFAAPTPTLQVYSHPHTHGAFGPSRLPQEQVTMTSQYPAIGTYPRESWDWHTNAAASTTMQRDAWPLVPPPESIQQPTPAPATQSYIVGGTASEEFEPFLGNPHRKPQNRGPPPQKQSHAPDVQDVEVDSPPEQMVIEQRSAVVVADDLSLPQWRWVPYPEMENLLEVGSTSLQRRSLTQAAWTNGFRGLPKSSPRNTLSKSELPLPPSKPAVWFRSWTAVLESSAYGNLRHGVQLGSRTLGAESATALVLQGSAGPDSSWDDERLTITIRRPVKFVGLERRTPSRGQANPRSGTRMKKRLNPDQAGLLNAWYSGHHVDILVKKDFSLLRFKLEEEYALLGAYKITGVNTSASADPTKECILQFTFEWDRDTNQGLPWWQHPAELCAFPPLSLGSAGELGISKASLHAKYRIHHSNLDAGLLAAAEDLPHVADMGSILFGCAICHKCGLSAYRNALVDWTCGGCKGDMPRWRASPDWFHRVKNDWFTTTVDFVHDTEGDSALSAGSTLNGTVLLGHLPWHDRNGTVDLAQALMPDPNKILQSFLTEPLPMLRISSQGSMFKWNDASADYFVHKASWKEKLSPNAPQEQHWNDSLPSTADALNLLNLLAVQDGMKRVFYSLTTVLGTSYRDCKFEVRAGDAVALLALRSPVLIKISLKIPPKKPRSPEKPKTKKKVIIMTDKGHFIEQTDNPPQAIYLKEGFQSTRAVQDGSYEPEVPDRNIQPGVVARLWKRKPKPLGLRTATQTKKFKPSQKIKSAYLNGNNGIGSRTRHAHLKRKKATVLNYAKGKGKGVGPGRARKPLKVPQSAKISARNQVVLEHGERLLLRTSQDIIVSLQWKECGFLCIATADDPPPNLPESSLPSRDGSEEPFHVRAEDDTFAQPNSEVLTSVIASLKIDTEFESEDPIESTSEEERLPARRHEMDRNSSFDSHTEDEREAGRTKLFRKADDTLALSVRNIAGDRRFVDPQGVPSGSPNRMSIAYLTRPSTGSDSGCDMDMSDIEELTPSITEKSDDRSDDRKVDLVSLSPAVSKLWDPETLSTFDRLNTAGPPYHSRGSEECPSTPRQLPQQTDVPAGTEIVSLKSSWPEFSVQPIKGRQPVVSGNSTLEIITRSTSCHPMRRGRDGTPRSNQQPVDELRSWATDDSPLTPLPSDIDLEMANEMDIDGDVRQSHETSQIDPFQATPPSSLYLPAASTLEVPPHGDLANKMSDPDEIETDSDVPSLPDPSREAVASGPTPMPVDLSDADADGETDPDADGETDTADTDAGADTADADGEEDTGDEEHESEMGIESEGTPMPEVKEEAPLVLVTGEGDAHTTVRVSGSPTGGAVTDPRANDAVLDSPADHAPFAAVAGPTRAPTPPGNVGSPLDDGQERHEADSMPTADHTSPEALSSTLSRILSVEPRNLELLSVTTSPLLEVERDESVDPLALIDREDAAHLITFINKLSDEEDEPQPATKAPESNDLPTQTAIPAELATPPHSPPEQAADPTDPEEWYGFPTPPPDDYQEQPYGFPFPSPPQEHLSHGEPHDILREYPMSLDPQPDNLYEPGGFGTLLEDDIEEFVD